MKGQHGRGEGCGERERARAWRQAVQGEVRTASVPMAAEGGCLFIYVECVERTLFSLSVCSQGFTHSRAAASVYCMKKRGVLFLKTSSPVGRNCIGFICTQYRSIMFSK